MHTASFLVAQKGRNSIKPGLQETTFEIRLTGMSDYFDPGKSIMKENGQVNKNLAEIKFC